MRVRLAAFVLLSVLLCGCANIRKLENQAHAITMGLDFKDDQITMTVQVPTIGGEASSGGGGGGGKESGKSSEYLTYSATATDFPSAYNLLSATLPQQLNLTQLKSIVVSESLAKSDNFLIIMREIMHIYALSGSAELLVSGTDAKKIIENQKPYIGTRLSVSVPAMLEYYARNGYVPETNMSLAYAGMKSLYSTEMTAYVNESTGKSGEGPQSDDNFIAGELNREGENKNEYMGAALFDREKMVGMLNGRETQLAHFLSGKDIEAAWLTGATSLKLTTKRKPRVNVDISDDGLSLDILVRLSVTALIDLPDISLLENELERDFMLLIKKCQNLKVEPFGFADKAVKKFATIDEWRKYEWTEKFSKADINLKVEAIPAE